MKKHNLIALSVFLVLLIALAPTNILLAKSVPTLLDPHRATSTGEPKMVDVVLSQNDKETIVVSVPQSKANEFKNSLKTLNS